MPRDKPKRRPTAGKNKTRRVQPVTTTMLVAARDAAFGCLDALLYLQVHRSTLESQYFAGKLTGKRRQALTKAGATIIDADGFWKGMAEIADHCEKAVAAFDAATPRALLDVIMVANADRRTEHRIAGRRSATAHQAAYWALKNIAYQLHAADLLGDASVEAFTARTRTSLGQFMVPHEDLESEINEEFARASARLESREIAKKLPPLTPAAQVVKNILDALPPGRALLGKDILTKLHEHQAHRSTTHSTLTTRILPQLVPWGLRNTPHVGYDMQSSPSEIVPKRRAAQAR